MRDYLNPAWREILAFNGLESFEALWERNPDAWFEPPNQRRGGWSGVVRLMLRLPQGGEVGVFIKRQENHFYRDLRHLFFPAATFEREFINLMRFLRLGIPTMEPVFFGQRKVEGNLRAILVTRELAGFEPLDAPRWDPPSKIERRQRKQLINKVAETVRLMHEGHQQHNCLYPKHIFVKAADNDFQVRLIDLEKVKWRPFKRLLTLRDLSSLQRHARNWSRTDRLRLFLAYRNETTLSEESKEILRNLFNRLRKKSKP